MKLAEKYGNKPVEEFPMLFQRILQNTIRDFYRRQKVRNMWTVLFSALRPYDDDDSDPLETLASESLASPTTPDQDASQSQILTLIGKEIEKLPTRQREAFLMRYVEELDIAETASVMGCSEGSVKTHCSRATKFLADAMRTKGITL